MSSSTIESSMLSLYPVLTDVTAPALAVGDAPEISPTHVSLRQKCIALCKAVLQNVGDVVLFMPAFIAWGAIRAFQITGLKKFSPEYVASYRVLLFSKMSFALFCIGCAVAARDIYKDYHAQLSLPVSV